ncbi:hypothetical protein RB601_006762 [Gaeumannomyces tritici]
MGEIYSSARLVVGSLGDGKDPNLGTGLQVLIDVCNAFAREKADMIQEMAFTLIHDPETSLEFETAICHEFTRESARDPVTKGKWRKFGHAASEQAVYHIGDSFEWLKSPSYLLESLEHWMTFCALATSAFFFRVWIVQERHLAKSLIVVTDDRCSDWRKHRYEMLAMAHWEPKVKPAEGETVYPARRRRMIAQFCR